MGAMPNSSASVLAIAVLIHSKMAVRFILAAASVLCEECCCVGIVEMDALHCIIMATRDSAKQKTKPKGKRSYQQRLAIIKGDEPVVNAKGKKVRGKLAVHLRKKALQGMTAEQAIFHLHINEGMPLHEVAQEIGMTFVGVKKAFRAMLETIADQSPKTEREFSLMREEVGARLMATYQDACGPIKRMDPRFLLVRLNAMRQLSTLYGLNLENEEKDDDLKPYATPDEIAAEVAKRQLAQFGRVHDVEAARSALAEASRQASERDVSPPKDQGAES